MKVKIRKKDSSEAKKSVYLDFYPKFLNPDTGKLQRFEFLGLYIYSKPRTQLERYHNKQTLELAENIRAKRQIEVQNGSFGFISKEKRRSSFVEYFRAVAEKKVGSNASNWEMGLRYFISYAGEDFRFCDLTEPFCQEFKEYMLSGPCVNLRNKPIGVNSAVAYYAKFRVMLKTAYKASLIVADLYELVPGIKPEETHREYLSLEEFKQLVATPSNNKLFKNVAVFSVLTGIRFCDINALQWGQVRGEVGGYELQFRQEKTTGVELLPISDEAFSLMGKRGKENELVFRGLSYNSIRTWLKDWLWAAGISKHITFHCFRHTFATLQLASGTDIFTISKMLGHRHVKTTQIYTKVVDDLKRVAARRISLPVTESV